MKTVEILVNVYCRSMAVRLGGQAGLDGRDYCPSVLLFFLTGGFDGLGWERGVGRLGLLPQGTGMSNTETTVSFIVLHNLRRSISSSWGVRVFERQHRWVSKMHIVLRSRLGQNLRPNLIIRFGQPFGSTSAIKT